MTFPKIHYKVSDNIKFRFMVIHSDCGLSEGVDSIWEQLTLRVKVTPFKQSLVGGRYIPPTSCF